VVEEVEVVTHTTEPQVAVASAQVAPAPRHLSDRISDLEPGEQGRSIG